ncbi:hypothetical protein [Treponema primitia]|uniref:hypothetical protein n=1 Tax=Treponema primitia TaxID=88058 RepID=UPI0002555570|nr:hypothetical protein [Treponema primitia]
MDWKTKAMIQNCISVLPKAISYEVYYLAQRHFGGLKKPFNPASRIAAGVGILKKIQKYHGSPSDKIFFEVGTGRVPIMPIVYWLGGAKKTITVDVNPYMREELLLETLVYINSHETEIRNVFEYLLLEDRFIALLAEIRRGLLKTRNLLSLCSIEYISPGDAARTTMPSGSIDYHTSYRVYDHIPVPALKDILEEGNRIVVSDGLFINYIDYGDHFFTTDKSISKINFLQYSDKAWRKYAGNRYMYVNRLRHDDFLALFEKASHTIVAAEPVIDKMAQKLLEEESLHLDQRFITKNKETLGIVGSWIITKK